jgi:predicted lipoprotein
MKKLSALLFITFTIFIAAAIVACNKNVADQPADDFDRKTLLTNTADNIIIPAYTNFQAVFTEMKTAAGAFTAMPDAGKLTALRQKWKAAYISWQQVELFNFGPAETVSLRNYFNIYPADVNLLRSHISSGTYNLEELANNKVQGFPALDYLLNGSGANDIEIVSNYTANADSEKWKKYLSDVVNTMDSKINKVVSDWKGSYRGQFINNDGTGAGSSMSLMINEYIMYFERFLRSGKFGIPAGVMSGTPAPEKVEAFYSKDLGIELAKTALNASSDFYSGKAFNGGGTGPGLYTYLQALGTNNANVTTLATNIQNQFGAISGKMNSLGNSIHNAIVNNRTSVLAVYDEMQKQVRYLKADMASAIGITISYTDNDGD